MPKAKLFTKPGSPGTPSRGLVTGRLSQGASLYAENFISVTFARQEKELNFKKIDL